MTVWTKEQFIQLFHLSEGDWLDWIDRELPVYTLRDGSQVLTQAAYVEWDKSSRSIMTRAEAAAYLHVSPKTLDRSSVPRIMLGKLPRYSRYAIDRYFEEKAVVQSEDVREPVIKTLPVSTKTKWRRGTKARSRLEELKKLVSQSR